MRNTWAVCKRELKSYFTTPVGYVILASFAALSGIFFAASFIEYASYTETPREKGLEGVPDLEEWMLSPFLVLCGQLIMFLGPLITMKLLAEERNRGTFELLMTYPLTDRQIVFGKYLASVVLVILLTSLITVHMGIVSYFGNIEPAVLVFGLLTVILMGAAFTSMGLFVSALSNNQITAGVMTFAVWLITYIAGRLAADLDAEIPIPSNWPEFAQSAAAFAYTLVRALLVELPLDAHAEEMAEGIVEPRDIIYYLLVIAFFLFCTLRAVEARRWRS